MILLDDLAVSSFLNVPIFALNVLCNYKIN
jgi:hypothetical protein